MRIAAADRRVCAGGGLFEQRRRHGEDRADAGVHRRRRRTSPPSTTPTVARGDRRRTAAAAGRAIADVIAWIEAGTPADAAGYHSMTRDGSRRPLDDGVAFTTAGTEANCMTDEYRDGALACLVKLTDPPPRPADVETQWKGNWVDFAGPTVDVGSPHGDPGPFGDGTGAELPAGQALAFGDYRCRADAAGLFCVNYAHQTAVEDERQPASRDSAA